MCLFSLVPTRADYPKYMIYLMTRHAWMNDLHFLTFGIPTKAISKTQVLCFSSSLCFLADDPTFATVHHGEFIPYATAGDCYSSVDCPQGRFHLSLNGTGLVVAPGVDWSTEGHSVSRRISRDSVSWWLLNCSKKICVCNDFDFKKLRLNLYWQQHVCGIHDKEVFYWL